MGEIFNWIEIHWDDILAIIGGIVSLASIIVKLTPSQKDDAILSKIISFFDNFSVFNPNGTKVVKDE